ncbi:membrane protein involved in the export of O-antigen and teichoic acid [Pseudarthrobacter phenanthrenivorans Sphe3]|uniref:Membrane protein involved in the export of O-antigen and teichoic acid n=1 Tax=Pseudarthrobacter phenanthrenivorans (strain DSM 18606 / JCM 16027 / LMG 23796 / Sphe3) TaxID=930171 RepID=F0MA43_PSEPM|nr:oligosaccharide flippase family protein [Pseudarthrobacter phenanthrenivorans]ADX75030.1 membrane protein involved in the export of O-antigen and teichoic acid [Pseudarthrobacter phenanthrenivorans Sphe3]
MTDEISFRVTTQESLPRQHKKGPTSNADLGSAVRRGAVWTAGSTVLLRLGNIALMAVVARIVSPRELGIFTLAVTVHAVIVSVAELGVASSIARSDLDFDRIAPTVASISIVSSFLMAAPMFIFADSIAAVLGTAAAGPALKILAVGVALIGPFAVPGAQLQRDFRQHVIFWASAIAFVPGSATLVLLALQGSGPEAFAWSRIVGQVVMGVVILAATGRPLVPRLNKSMMRPLLAFGLPLAGANLLSQVLLNADYLFIGPMLGAAELGIYFLAFSIAMWPTAVIGSMLNGLVLPAISAVRRDGGDMAGAVTLGLRTVALIAFPLAAFLSVFSLELVKTIYGPAWLPAAPVLSVLAIYGAVSVVGLFLANVIIASGRTGVLLGVQLCALAVLLPGLPAAIHLGGIQGAALMHVIVVVAVTSPVYVVALRRSTGLRIPALLAALQLPAATTALTGLAAWLVTLALEDPLLKLIVAGNIGMCVYALLNWRDISALIPARFLIRLARVKSHFCGHPSSQERSSQ